MCTSTSLCIPCAGTGVIGNCELPIVCVGNWTLVLWNRSKCSYCWVISPNSFRFLLLPLFILLSLPSPPPLVIIRMPLPWTLHGEILSLVWGFFLCVGLWQWTSGSKVSTHRYCVATAVWMENSRASSVVVVSIFIRGRKCVSYWTQLFQHLQKGGANACLLVQIIAKKMCLAKKGLWNVRILTMLC